MNVFILLVDCMLTIPIEYTMLAAILTVLLVLNIAGYLKQWKSKGRS